MNEIEGKHTQNNISVYLGFGAKTQTVNLSNLKKEC
jgi:hypothetical protein